VRVAALVGVAGALGFLSCGSPARPTPPVEPTPVTIACPQPVTVTSPLGQPMTVVYPDAIGGSGAPPVTISCTPASASTFPIGATSVSCTATDTRQRTASCQFAVTVNMPPRISLTRFVAFGDSITEGEIGDAVNPTLTFQSPSQAYPSVLRQLLTARYSAQSIALDPAGVQGESASGSSTFSRFVSYTSSRRYDAITILEGSNDIATGDPAAVGRAANALRQMVRDAKSRSVRPYLATIPPTDATRCVPACRGRDMHAFVVPLNDAIRNVAASEGITLIDVYAALNVDVARYIGADGLHPTIAGNQQIAQTFFDVLQQTLEVPASSNAALAGGRGIRK